ncbi:Zn-ribbon domain-containing OB-fold protein [Thermoactinospora rubra]|uniref:Zn-ribbon domain-containing OB-fold protein n=1 Tax=Thermoactinospora rubra TaxID=1088767 RepID=UPI000A1040C7|nr:zinc ribbon domain-containing protein [Thermoactinospora rubra]
MDRDSREWWERVAGGELAVQECAACGTPRFPARAFCPACRTEGWRWRAVEPVAEVESWIVSHRAFGGAGPGTVVRVRLAAARECAMYGRWLAGREPRAGELVRAIFSQGADRTLVDWAPME